MSVEDVIYLLMILENPAIIAALEEEGYRINYALLLKYADPQLVVIKG